MPLNARGDRVSLQPPRLKTGLLQQQKNRALAVVCASTQRHACPAPGFAALASRPAPGALSIIYAMQRCDRPSPMAGRHYCSPLPPTLAAATRPGCCLQAANTLARPSHDKHNSTQPGSISMAQLEQQIQQWFVVRLCGTAQRHACATAAASRALT